MTGEVNSSVILCSGKSWGSIAKVLMVVKRFFRNFSSFFHIMSCLAAILEDSTQAVSQKRETAFVLGNQIGMSSLQVGVGRDWWSVRESYGERARGVRNVLAVQRQQQTLNVGATDHEKTASFGCAMATASALDSVRPVANAASNAESPISARRIWVCCSCQLR